MSQIAIHGGHDHRQAIRDFAVDAIDLITNAQIPVVWALKLPRDEFAFTAEDVLKYLVSQVLRVNHTLLNERSAGLNAARFQSATTIEEWFSLLGAVLRGLPRVFLIVDLGLLHSEVVLASAWTGLFEQLFAEIVKRNMQTVLKVAFLGTRASHRGHLDELGRKIAVLDDQGNRARK